jgi:uncharacterized glyoxalase superfamily protein PhnB
MHTNLPTEPNVIKKTPSEERRLKTDGGEPKTNGDDIQETASNISPDLSVETADITDRPAVGILATGTTADIIRTIYEGLRNELAVFVAVTDNCSTLAQISYQLGATVIEVPSNDIDLADQKVSLLQAVRKESHPGLIFAGTCSETIDFEASLEAFNETDQTITDAIPESAQTNILVGITAYNEAETIGTVIEAALDHADEVIVVDDGSTDQTASRARESGAVVVEHDRNRGYGCGLKTIFEEANKRSVEVLLIIDGDDQHDTSDIPKLIAEHQRSEAEIVIGKRFGETTATDMPLYRRSGLWVINSLVNLSMGKLRPASQITDAQSGFRSYNTTAVRSIAENTHVIDDRMSASTDILQFANSQGFTIAEVPTTITYDVSNPSTRHPISQGYSIVRRIITTFERERPVTVYGIPGLLLSLSGIGVAYWTISEFVTSGTVVSEYVLLSMLLVFLGSISVFMSVVQYSLNVSLDQLGSSE